MTDPALSVQAVQEALGAHAWRGQILVYDSLPSTNTFAAELAKNGVPSGTVVLANAQSAGRGRRGRSFYSPDGEGLYMSLVLRPDAKPENLLHLTAMTAVAVCDAIEAVCGFRPDIKWTNDLVCGKKKLGGILTELSVSQGACAYAIIGIGINCAQTDFPEEIEDIATSLCQICGVRVDRAALAGALMRALARMDAALLTEKEVWMARYRENCITLGREVQILRADTITCAFAESVTLDGALRVRYADGTYEDVSSGEVSVRGMYGYVDEMRA